MTGWGGGNPDAADAGSDDRELTQYECPKCENEYGQLAHHLRACTGGDAE